MKHLDLPLSRRRGARTVGNLDNIQ